ncbi:MAG: peptidylprolyl isomerase [Candidatus Zixiibacteriota bacterium]|nr:MAG: peptidylprolyl isomerase [candidate division Zixibacteria bacterium]
MKYGTVVIAILITGSIVYCDKAEQDHKVILARVNNEVLTYEDIIYQIPPDLRVNLTDENLQEAVETWINTEVLYQRAVERGLDKEPDVEAMIKWGIKETVAKKLIDSEISSKISLSPGEIDSIYRTQKDRFKVEQDRFRASHILLDDYETATAVYNRLKKGSDFENLAVDYSRDRLSAKSGGDIGYFSADQVELPFAEAVKGLKEGAYSNPVKTSYGFHIIMLTERIEAGTRLDSLEAVKMIENQLLAGRHAESFQKIVDSLRAESDIEIFSLPGPEERMLQDGQ